MPAPNPDRRWLAILLLPLAAMPVVWRMERSVCEWNMCAGGVAVLFRSAAANFGDGLALFCLVRGEMEKGGH